MDNCDGDGMLEHSCIFCRAPARDILQSSAAAELDQNDDEERESAGVTVDLIFKIFDISSSSDTEEKPEADNKVEVVPFCLPCSQSFCKLAHLYKVIQAYQTELNGLKETIQSSVLQSESIKYELDDHGLDKSEPIPWINKFRDYFIQGGETKTTAEADEDGSDAESFGNFGSRSTSPVPPSAASYERVGKPSIYSNGIPQPSQVELKEFKICLNRVNVNYNGTLTDLPGITLNPEAAKIFKNRERSERARQKYIAEENSGKENPNPTGSDSVKLTKIRKPCRKPAIPRDSWAGMTKEAIIARRIQKKLNKQERIRARIVPGHPTTVRTPDGRRMYGDVEFKETEDGGFRCGVCENTYYRSLAGVLSHIKKKHVSLPPASKATCTICQKSFIYKSQLADHMRTHDESKKNVVCEHCGKKFLRIQELKVHVRIHTGEKPFPCKFCGRAFTARGSVRTHEKTHMKEGKFFNCGKCQEKFTRSSELAKHRKEFHPFRKGTAVTGVVPESSIPVPAPGSNSSIMLIGDESSKSDDANSQPEVAENSTIFYINSDFGEGFLLNF